MQSCTIKKLLSDVQSGRICLPSIQRPFVWDQKKIEQLFDSIYRGYPFGSFLFWNLSETTFESYSFFQLVKDYHEIESRVGVTFQPDHLDFTLNNYAIIDGQQRISSLNIGFNGSFTTLSKNGTVSTKLLYFNIIPNSVIMGVEGQDDEDSDGTAIFKFMTESEARRINNSSSQKNALWYKVSNFLHDVWDIFLPVNPLAATPAEVNQRRTDMANMVRAELIRFQAAKGYSQAWIDDQIDFCIHHISYFVTKIKVQELVNYDDYQFNNRLVNMTEVFVRINQGVSLTKLDLLFSTLIANWEEGKQHIDSLCSSLADLGFKNLDREFVLRTCLYLSPGEVLFSIQSFKPQTIAAIQNNFIRDDGNDYRSAILDVANFLVEMGVEEKDIKSKNVLIPLVFHLFKGGFINTIESKRDALKFIFVAHLGKVFSSHNDSLLSNLRRNALDEAGNLVSQNFDYFTLVDDLTEQAKREAFFPTENKIEQWLELTKESEVRYLLHILKDPSLADWETQIKDLHIADFVPLALRNALGENFNKCCKQLSNRAWVPSNLNYSDEESLLVNYQRFSDANKQTLNQYAQIPHGVSLDGNDVLIFWQSRKSLLKGQLEALFGI